eukprot:scaffold4461_cov263-Pinguiococcus_pyrenoidosus.AAC.2
MREKELKKKRSESLTHLLLGCKDVKEAETAMWIAEVGSEAVLRRQVSTSSWIEQQDKFEAAKSTFDAAYNRVQSIIGDGFGGEGAWQSILKPCPHFLSRHRICTVHPIAQVEPDYNERPSHAWIRKHKAALKLETRVFGASGFVPFLPSFLSFFLSFVPRAHSTLANFTSVCVAGIVEPLTICVGDIRRTFSVTVADPWHVRDLVRHGPHVAFHGAKEDQAEGATRKDNEPEAAQSSARRLGEEGIAELQDHDDAGRHKTALQSGERRFRKRERLSPLDWEKIVRDVGP